MQVVVTGAGNPTGAAIVEALLKEGHHVRIFGVSAEVASRFEGAQWHPGALTVGGSIEPVLSERQALIHAACLDAPGADKRAHAIHIERGTLYTRYGAEREQVDHLIHIAPRDMDKGHFHKFQAAAVETIEATRGALHWKVIHDNPAGPEETAELVLAALREGGRLGKQPGRDTDAVTI